MDWRAQLVLNIIHLFDTFLHSNYIKFVMCTNGRNIAYKANCSVFYFLMVTPSKFESLTPSGPSLFVSSIGQKGILHRQKFIFKMRVYVCHDT